MKNLLFPQSFFYQLFLRMNQEISFQLQQVVNLSNYLLLLYFYYPFIEPAKIPRTKYRCREKNIIKGNTIDINAAAVSKCQF